jgi:AcrR family transcriptional regulator
MIQDISTEEKIIEAAKKVFFKKGLSGARMQDIADEAGINKALLHYYFRSKEKLFEIIVKDAVSIMIPRLNEIFNSHASVTEKIEQIVYKYISTIIDFPYIPSFVIHELNQNPERIMKTVFSLNEKPMPHPFLAQIKEEVERGIIRPIDPRQLLVNIVSMCLFPFLGEHLLKGILKLSDAEFKHFLNQRKKEVAHFVIRSIQP